METWKSSFEFSIYSFYDLPCSFYQDLKQVYTNNLFVDIRYLQVEALVSVFFEIVVLRNCFQISLNHGLNLASGRQCPKFQVWSSNYLDIYREIRFPISINFCPRASRTLNRDMCSINYPCHAGETRDLIE
jgi:hypothetical protein